MYDIILQFVAWVGVLVALAVAAIAVGATVVYIIYKAFSPSFTRIAGWLQRRRIIRVTARYARRFPVLLVLAAYRGRP